MQAAGTLPMRAAESPPTIVVLRQAVAISPERLQSTQGSLRSEPCARMLVCSRLCMQVWPVTRCVVTPLERIHLNIHKEVLAGVSCCPRRGIFCLHIRARARARTHTHTHTHTHTALAVSLVHLPARLADSSCGVRSRIQVQQKDWSAPDECSVGTGSLQTLWRMTSIAISSHAC